jgi:hypothetical protein
MSVPSWTSIAELVRAPAALTVPGDMLAGAAVAGASAGFVGRRAGPRHRVGFEPEPGMFVDTVAALDEVRHRGLVSVELPQHSHAAPVLARDSLAVLRKAAP